MKFSQNQNIFIQQNAFEKVVSETASILFRPKYANTQRHEQYSR